MNKKLIDDFNLTMRFSHFATVSKLNDDIKSSRHNEGW